MHFFFFVLFVFLSLSISLQACGATPRETLVPLHSGAAVALPCVDIELAYDTLLVPVHSLPDLVKAAL